VPPVSSKSFWTGYTMPLTIILLGILGLIIDPIFLLAFVVLVGYYLYRLEKRVSQLEGDGTGQQPAKPKQDKSPAQ